jgi:Na+-translocating ferredoxin:NAD+ oxidoreductase RnfD subunit
LGALLIMPIQSPDGWTIVMVKLFALEPAVAVTYVSYILLASPLAFIALILAPITAPTSNFGRVIYGLIIGAGLILAQWTLHSPGSTYLSLLAASALARPLDWLHPRPFAK